MVALHVIQEMQGEVEYYTTHKGISFYVKAQAFGVATSIQAKGQVLLAGINVCLHNGFTSFVIECDSQILV